MLSPEEGEAYRKRLEAELAIDLPAEDATSSETALIGSGAKQVVSTNPEEKQKHEVNNGPCEPENATRGSDHGSFPSLDELNRDAFQIWSDVIGVFAAKTFPTALWLVILLVFGASFHLDLWSCRNAVNGWVPDEVRFDPTNCFSAPTQTWSETKTEINPSSFFFQKAWLIKSWILGLFLMNFFVTMSPK